MRQLHGEYANMTALVDVAKSWAAPSRIPLVYSLKVTAAPVCIAREQRGFGNGGWPSWRASIVPVSQGGKLRLQGSASARARTIRCRGVVAGALAMPRMADIYNARYARAGHLLRARLSLARSMDSFAA
jgi:hypothetical protein